MGVKVYGPVSNSEGNWIWSISCSSFQGRQ